MAGKTKETTPVPVDAQVEQLQVQLEQKQNEVNSQGERIQALGGFQKEAIDGREKIEKLEAKVAGLETQLSQATKQASAAESAATTAASTSAGAQKKLAAAEDLAKAVKTLLGS